MFSRSLVFLLIISTICAAQQTQKYKDILLDDVFKVWDKVTKDYEPGVTIMPPEKAHFFAKYVAAPMPCSNDHLQLVFTMIGVPDFLKQVPITHCIKLSAQNGRVASAYIQDSLVKGIESDATLNGQIEIYADLLGYEVDQNRGQNMPVLLVNRFEPK
jgi:hypothetical protein